MDTPAVVRAKISDLGWVEELTLDFNMGCHAYGFALACYDDASSNGHAHEDEAWRPGHQFEATRSIILRLLLSDPFTTQFLSRRIPVLQHRYDGNPILDRLAKL